MYCKAAGPAVKSGIVDHYRTQGGSAQGLPVTVIDINLGWWLEGLPEDHPDNTDAFIAAIGLELVADDFLLEVFRAFGGTGMPHFAVVNGVADSPSHAQWEIVALDGNGWPPPPADPTPRISTLRAYIDAVAAPLIPPVIESVHLIEGAIEFDVISQAGRPVSVEYTTDFRSWTTIATTVGATGITRFREDLSPDASIKAYRARLE